MQGNYKYFFNYTSLTLIYIFFFIVLYNNVTAQYLYKQDLFYGGITGDGKDSSPFTDTLTVNVQIEPGSTIKSAELFVLAINFPGDKIILFNNNPVLLSLNNSLSTGYYEYIVGGAPQLHHILSVDVTPFITASTLNYNIVTPDSGSEWMNSISFYRSYYLLVTYENPALQRVNSVVYFNTQNSGNTINYIVSPINIINTFNDIGFTFQGTDFCEVPQDSSFVFVNGNNLGLVGGVEPGEHSCSGVRGSFYYQNSTLFGYDYDTANITMNGIDALANIQPYLTSNDSIHFAFQYQNPGASDGTNPIHELFLAYTTPCDTFSVSVPNDTIVCRGTQLQLNVSGGQKYEWLPSTGLSCDTCANPIFTADSSMNYTVRIWNNDSCSVVHPLQILVSQPRIDTLIISPPTCGTNDGEIAVNASSFSWLDLSYSSGGAFQTDSVLSNLAEGTITITVQDEAGCSVDTTFFLPSVNNTNALFTVNPPGGEDVPMVIWANSTSQNANQFEWWIDSVLVGNNNEQYHTFNTSGTHEIMLVACQYDPNCADTSIFEFNIKRKVIIPTAFTPDGDGINDFWEILYLDELYPQNKVFVYNRWGNLVYESEEGKYGERAWAGASTSSATGTTGSAGGGRLPVGSYFYVIKTGTDDADFTGSVTIVR